MSGYEVRYVEERPTIGAGGKLVDHTVIFLETFLGNSGSLSIPTSNYDALTASEEGKQTLKELLQGKADSLDAPFEL